MEALLDLGMLVCFIGGPALLLRLVMHRPQRRDGVTGHRRECLREAGRYRGEPQGRGKAES